MEGAIREGFLVKKSRKRHCWKTRWFVLGEDRLKYCRKKDRQTPVGCLKLTGCSVAYPVEGYEKRRGIFQLVTLKGKQHLLQAPTDNDRDIWAHAITAVIRAKATRKPRPTSIRRKLGTNVDLSEILGAMQDLDAGIPMVTHVIDGAENTKCFAGDEAIDWLKTWSFVIDREEGIKLCQTLLKLAHIIPVHDQNVTKKTKIDVSTTVSFQDAKCAIYKFSSLTPPPSTSSLFASSSSEESSESSEGVMSDGDLLDDHKTRKSKPTVKEGFLLKRGYMRKQWKSRRVVLRDNPPTIEYYTVSKHENEPLKVLNLIGANIVDVNQDAQKHRGVPGYKKKKPVFCIQLSDDKTMVFQAEDDHDKSTWITSLNKLCAL